jgi:hypothetical protein
MRTAFVAFAVFFFVALTASAAEPLFPAPLHITRQVEDPISGKTVVLNEYAYGNRLVSVRGNMTAIADYERGELTEIDREKGTYSITRFETVAKAAQSAGAPEQPVAAKAGRAPRSVAARSTKSGRRADFFAGEVENAELKQTVEVGVDRSVRLSREALEVLLGSAYPGVRRSEHEILIAAAAPARLMAGPTSQTPGPAASGYALPIEQITRFEAGGEILEFRNSVVRVGNESPPAELIAIPAGAQLVTSRLSAVVREIELIDRPIVPKNP